jgi:anti-sigma factor RsiW
MAAMEHADGVSTPGAERTTVWRRVPRSALVALLGSGLLSSCFTLAISDPSGKDPPVPDGVRQALLPATVAADVVTAPVQALAVGGYAAGKTVASPRKPAPVPVPQEERAGTED